MAQATADALLDAPITIADRGSVRLRDVIDRICAICDPISIILFGSRARGEGGQNGDADLLVVVPPEKRTRELWGSILDALADMPLISDIVLATPAELAEFSLVPSLVYYYAAREGKVLYERR